MEKYCRYIVNEHVVDLYKQCGRKRESHKPRIKGNIPFEDDSMSGGLRYTRYEHVHGFLQKVTPNIKFSNWPHRHFVAK